MVEGAPQGWRADAGQARGGSRADAGRRPASARGPRRIPLERTYDAPVARVFKALSDEAAKSQWFSGDGGPWTQHRACMDFRVGGRELLKGRWEGGAVTSTFDAVYLDIAPE